MGHTVKIKSIEKITHDVLQIVVDKPEGFTFEPGQATDVAINKKGWDDKPRSFTFTSLPDEDHLEFVIKTYPSHDGVTNEMLSLAAGDELILHDVYGAISYQGEGVFLAGGAGVTPFIAILKALEAKQKIGNNKLIFANKTSKDIIHANKFKTLLGTNFINILSDEKTEEHEHGFISADLIRKHQDGTTKYYYLCGPEPMMEAVEEHLASLGVAKDAIVKESFD